MDELTITRRGDKIFFQGVNVNEDNIKTLIDAAKKALEKDNNKKTYRNEIVVKCNQ